MEKFDSIETALEVLSKGGLVIVSDDENRENEGDLVGIAELVTPESINFMITHGKGLVCMPISKDIAKNLDIPLMVENNTESLRTAFTVSIDAHAKHGVTTGISAWDRAKTIQLAVSDDSTPADFVRPGHIFPLIAEDGGVFTRNGHTEASTDLAKLAGYKRAAVIVEIILPDGSMARQQDLFSMRRLFNIPYITIESLKKYREKHDVVEKVLTTIPE
ncbi:MULTISPECIES: 3,4-dihydroxy-2-butanone-4-phosphate synthase [Bacillus cereus group]|uniref:3,4-dihydroxy-2-butanone-4-phosphate synthase n=1 Tax=Bacillus cereus group TaxID=86661 RepID=UPI00111F198D|nr:MULTISPECIES: 3,4-dihydroxy-2-butanone-4-phosphate synthase [Bacillus cereus group]MEC2921432.1 3,4-dihydroxy-2-butanone-4-phosphate synthase [Bacillus tropicus]MEC2926539.1 3,4-dihydroxy-2-butanone-4-phosphate synthase [Bacillus tropicus]MEC2956132.1 3,4-dihydroxy-2-butanone-4-phosphate synthase [Bacillus tropicus]MEC3051567.1 3,4-dihydroxy-2-butanone-4-phosphate synthase [Bacillus tropicus]MEC3078002.1 3,4-dihydroxy-2-butanone-4-phosphate synthase [Bacillus tropicus]